MQRLVCRSKYSFIQKHSAALFIRLEIGVGICTFSQLTQARMAKPISSSTGLIYTLRVETGQVLHGWLKTVVVILPEVSSLGTGPAKFPVAAFIMLYSFFLFIVFLIYGIYLTQPLRLYHHNIVCYECNYLNSAASASRLYLQFNNNTGLLIR